MAVPAAIETRGRLARRSAVLTAVVAGLVFAVSAGLLIPWDWVPGGDVRPASASELFSPAEIARAEEFSSVRRYLGWAAYFLPLLLALVLGLTPLGSRLLRPVSERLRWWLSVPVGVLLLLLVGRLATLPFSIAIQDRNRDYGLSNQAWTAWTVDYAKSLLVSWVLTTLLVLVVVGTARRSPRHWFAWAGGLVVVLTVGASFLYPVVVEPLFNKFTPMQSGSFKASVFRLAEDEGVHIDDVLVADASRRTTTLNAYVSGFGGTRRVVVYDNLIEDLPPAEARVVIAHELAHAKHGDVLTGTVLGAVGGVFGVALLALVLDSRRLRSRAAINGPADPAAVASILALVAAGTFLASPLQNTMSRAVEARADRDSIAATARDEVFVRMQHELAISALSDPTPPGLSQLWFGSHPTVLQRAGLPSSLEAAQ